MPPADIETPNAEALVGRKLRALRLERGYSLRELAETSGLSINTLSLVENGKTSPSVATLQQLARALDVPLAAFFDATPQPRRIVFTPAGARPRMDIAHAVMHNLGQDLAGSAVQPFIVCLPPGAGSGDAPIVHTGHELVFGLSGAVRYCVDGQTFTLGAGDCLVFEAHLPHQWHNESTDEAQILLVIYPADRHEAPGGHHFELH